MSGDFRLRDAAAYEQYYGAKHPHPELLGTFVYGLPELNREAIRGGAVGRVARLLRDDDRARAAAAGARRHAGGRSCTSSASPARRAAASRRRPGTHHPVRAVNLKTYKPLEHQHTPEIIQTLAAAGAHGVELRFVPVSAPLSRGILATCFVELPADETADRIAALYADAYEARAVRALVRDRLPEVAAVAGTNYAEVGFTLGEPPRRRASARWRSSARPTT